LGNVLVSFDPQLACRNLAERFGAPIRLADEALYRSGLQARFERGEIGCEQYATSLRERFNRTEAQMPTRDVLDAVSDMFTSIDSMRGLMRDVRRRGYPIGILSNTCHAHWDWITRQPDTMVDGRFEAIVLSFQVGAMKPDDAIYAAAEEAAGVASDRIGFLDDKPENVAAATSRGWNAVQCLGGPQAAAALRALGVTGDSP
jgi:FMN phosphatase YigB (HAD superfamily)